MNPREKVRQASTALLQMPLGRGVKILTEAPGGLLAFAKPAGVLSHPNSREDQDRALLTCRYDLEGEFYEWEESGVCRRLWLLNRLDSATSGVLIGALHEELANSVREGFRLKHVTKVYNALVFGSPSVPRQVWRDRVSVEKKGGQIRTKAGAGNVPCESHMQLLQRKGGVALIRLEPRTGRSHQLRVQCAMRKLPIVGDATYGDFGANKVFAKAQGTKRLFLHSMETQFDYEYAGKTHRFVAKAPLPEEFVEALR